jgi:hypothetical protein
VCCTRKICLSGQQNCRFFFQEAAEFWSKLLNSVVNGLGIVALIIAIAETQQLNFRDETRRHINIEMDLVSSFSLLHSN